MSKFTSSSMLLCTWSTNEIHPANPINRAGNTLLTDSHKIIHPVLGQTHTKLYTLFRIERSKTISCPAAHLLIRPYKEVSQVLPPPFCNFNSQLFLVFPRIISFLVSVTDGCNTIQYNIFLLILPEGLFRINLQYVYIIKLRLMRYMFLIYK